MKKGFTLVEIIISIALITILGITATFLLVNNKNDEDIESTTKTVLEAANVYINTEVDEYGNTYKTGILSGGKGVQLSVQNLIDKGYIKEDEIEKLNDDPNDLYILAALTTNDESLCGEGSIEYTVSWDPSKKDPVYLCGYKENEAKIKTLYNTIKENRNCKTYSKTSVNGSFSTDNENYWNSDEFDSKIFDSDIIGICNIDDNNYFYLGNINNNYIKINGTDTLFRIIKTEGKPDNSGHYVKLAAYERISANPPGSTENNNFWWYENNLQYLYDTSHYDYFSFSASWNADGTISLNVSPSIHYGYCSSQTYTYGGWTDSNIKNHIGCTGSASIWNTKVIKNPYYELIYNPLNSWFLSLDEKIKNVVVEYKYCIKKDDCENYYINSKFATLDEDDYKNILKEVYKKSNKDLRKAFLWDTKITIDDFAVNEIVFSSLATGFTRSAASGKWYNYNYNNIHLRPVIMIDGDINVLSGVGTKDDPYILESE